MVLHVRPSRVWSAAVAAVLIGLFSMPAQGQDAATEKPDAPTLADAPEPANASPPASAATPADAPPVAPVDDDTRRVNGTESWPRHEIYSRVMVGVEYSKVTPQAAQPHPLGLQPGESFDDFRPFLRQARIKAKVHFHRDLLANISLELADGMRPERSSRVTYLRNAYINVRADDALQIRAGRFKRPYSALELTSTGVLPFRGRGLLNDLVIEDEDWGDRALGAMIWGKYRPQRLKWQLAVSQAAWASNRDTQPAGYTVQARLEYGIKKWLTLGAGGGHKYTNYDDVEAQLAGRPKPARLLAASADVALKTKRLRLALEILAAQRRICGASSDLDGICVTDDDVASVPRFDPLVGDVFDRGTATRDPLAIGVTAYAAYGFPMMPGWVIEPVIFMEWADADRDYTRTEAVRAMGGANLLWGDHLRLMAQLEIVEPLGSVRYPLNDDGLLAPHLLTRPVNPWIRTTTAYLLLSAQM